MVKRILLLIVLLSSLSFSGCIKPINLNNQAIVQAVSLDMVDNKIKVGLQIFSPSKSGEGKIGASADNAKVIESTGDTVSQAIQNANLMQGKKIFTGHNRVIIIGEEFAKMGLNQALDYFKTNTFARKNIYLIIAKGQAIDIISSKINEGILPAEVLEKIISNAKKVGYADNVKLYEFQNAMVNKHNSAILPVLSKIEVPKGDKASSGGEKSDDSEKIEPVSQIIVSGCGIISNNKTVKLLNAQETRGVLWLRGKVDTTTVIAKTDKLKLACIDITKTKTKIIPDVSKDKIKLTVAIDCKGTLSEVQIKDGKTIDTSEIKIIQKNVEQLIKNECFVGFNKAIKESKADVFNFGDMVWRDNVSIWRELKKDWQNNLGIIELEVVVNVDVDSVGLEFDTKA